LINSLKVKVTVWKPSSAATQKITGMGLVFAEAALSIFLSDNK
jgi:hypothetical protein